MLKLNEAFYALTFLQVLLILQSLGQLPTGQCQLPYGHLPTFLAQTLTFAHCKAFGHVCVLGCVCVREKERDGCSFALTLQFVSLCFKLKYFFMSCVLKCFSHFGHFNVILYGCEFFKNYLEFLERNNIHMHYVSYQYHAI